MKKPPTKAQIRRQIEQQTEDYLVDGGEVARVDRGISGRENAAAPVASPLFNEPRVPRTQVIEAVSAIEARRRPEKSANKSSKTPKQKLIYDDFGEPLRWVWEND
ncbi:MAG: hypothetical protein V7711_10790 [Pseudomonadales bacterium]